MINTGETETLIMGMFGTQKNASLATNPIEMKIPEIVRLYSSLFPFPQYFDIFSFSILVLFIFLF
jgi:hypothetical protein